MKIQINTLTRSDCPTAGRPRGRAVPGLQPGPLRDRRRAPGNTRNHPPRRTPAPEGKAWTPSAHAPTRQVRSHRRPKAPAHTPRAEGGAKLRGRAERAQIIERRAKWLRSAGGRACLPERLDSRTTGVAAHQTPACVLIEESRLRFITTGNLQTEAGAAFRMKLGLGEDRLASRREGWRVRACVVGYLHVRLGRGLPALRGPASRPFPCRSIFPDARSRLEEGRLGLPARPRLYRL